MDAKFLPKKSLPSHDELSDIVDKVTDVLENESESYRPKDSAKNPGALIDFSNDEIPVIVVPDLHARPKFIKNILEYQIKKESGFLKSETDETILSALEKNLVRVVCVGDALHSEKTRDRWCAAEEEYLSENYTGSAMKEEMILGLSLLEQIMNLKISFPENFHFLKGNHENIMNENGNGNYSFRKYAREGDMVKSFMSKYYGDDILYLISLWEDDLPLVYANPNCVVSHAEPAIPLTRDEIIDARLTDGVVESLTWTDNDAAQNGSVKKIINALLPEKNIKDAVYFGGHRPVEGNYNLRQGGKYIQLHNPVKQNVAFVRTDKIFNPDTDIIGVENGK